jgi:hypothetical protein
MRCFYHPDTEAVGLCKHCSRGICRDCTAQREGGLACQGKHEEMVDLISQLVGRNVRLSARSASTSLLAVIVYWGAGFVCSYLLFRETADTLRLLFGVMAAVMFLAAISNTRVLISRTNGSATAPEKT